MFEQMESKPVTTLHRNSRVLIVDSLNTFLRNFVAIHHLNPSGAHIGGLGGFLKSIGAAIRDIEPTRVILVFDGHGGSTNKRYLYPEYKTASGRLHHLAINGLHLARTVDVLSLPIPRVRVRSGIPLCLAYVARADL